MTAKELLVANHVFEKPEISNFNLILYRDAHVITQKNIEKSMIEFAKYHVQKALKKASEIADDWENSGELAPEILNAYPLENIK